VRLLADRVFDIGKSDAVDLLKRVLGTPRVHNSGLCNVVDWRSLESTRVVLGIYHVDRTTRD